MKAHELRRLLRETGESAANLINKFEKMIDNTNEKRERELLEKLKKAIVDYNVKKVLCEKNGLKVKINIRPAAVKIMVANPPLELQLTERDLLVLKAWKISIENSKD
ncbi:MAG: hypothetical protein AAB556_01765 [Patescibacteria group bacterium]